LAKIFSVPVKNKTVFNSIKFVATKKRQLFFHPPLLLLLLDPGSGSWIRNKPAGSATLLPCTQCFGSGSVLILVSWNRIRIRISYADPDPDPGGQKRPIKIEKTFEKSGSKHI
jgi:hypothetical protein